MDVKGFLFIRHGKTQENVGRRYIGNPDAPLCTEFERIAEASFGGITVIVIRGGNIMSILERFALSRQDFYAYYVQNCGFSLGRYEKGLLAIEQKGGAT